MSSTGIWLVAQSMFKLTGNLSRRLAFRENSDDLARNKQNCGITTQVQNATYRQILSFHLDYTVWIIPPSSPDFSLSELIYRKPSMTSSGRRAGRLERTDWPLARLTRL
jgi:hypothetical protein